MLSYKTTSKLDGKLNNIGHLKFKFVLKIKRKLL